MHLVLISPTPYENGIVWLEDRGRRVISSSGFPRGFTRELFEWTWNNREDIEVRWLRFMAMKGWLSVCVDWDRPVLVCYPGEATEFTRQFSAEVWAEPCLPCRPRSVAPQSPAAPATFQ